jgi:DNA mismatch repair protein MutS2
VLRKQRELEAQLADVESAKANLVEESRQELQGRLSEILGKLSKAERSLDAAEISYSAEASANVRFRQEIQADRSDLKDVQRQLESPDWSPIKVERIPWQQILKEGDRVYIRGVSQAVEVISPADDHDRVEVLLGTMRAKIPVYQLERKAEGHNIPVPRGVHLDRALRKEAVKSSNAELDLRGMRVDEALSHVDEALNDAVLDGTGSIRMIHGKGTGALRRAVREYLGGHPLVMSAEDGEGPGGDGVTVAELG